MKTDSGKTIRRKIIVPINNTPRYALTSRGITNLRALPIGAGGDRLNEILGHILNGKQNMLQNRNNTETDTEDNGDDEEEHEIPEEARYRVIDRSDLDLRNTSIRSGRPQKTTLSKFLLMARSHSVRILKHTEQIRLHTLHWIYW